MIGRRSEKNLVVQKRASPLSPGTQECERLVQKKIETWAPTIWDTGLYNIVLYQNH